MSIWKKHINAFAIGILFWNIGFILDAFPSYAGSINEAEAAIIAAASGTFMYQGETYRATSAALSQLNGYLAADGIDLTASQAEKAIAYMYNNVETGVRNGYIEKVSNRSQKPSEQIDPESSQVSGETEGTGETRSYAGLSDETNDNSDTSQTSKETEENFTESTAPIYNGVGAVKDTGYYLMNLWLVFFVFFVLIGTGGIIVVRNYTVKRKCKDREDA